MLSAITDTGQQYVLPEPWTQWQAGAALYQHRYLGRLDTKALERAAAGIAVDDSMRLVKLALIEASLVASKAAEHLATVITQNPDEFYAEEEEQFLGLIETAELRLRDCCVPAPRIG